MAAGEKSAAIFDLRAGAIPLILSILRSRQSQHSIILFISQTDDCLFFIIHYDDRVIFVGSFGNRIITSHFNVTADELCQIGHCDVRGCVRHDKPRCIVGQCVTDGRG